MTAQHMTAQHNGKAAVPSFSRDRVADGVTSYLRHMILTGGLQAGQHLRVEHLASQLQISVTPIRESLLELLAEGYVEREPRRGYVVAQVTRDGFADQVLVLALISGELAARAAGKACDAEIQDLTRLQRELLRAERKKDRALAEELNHRFHGTLNKLAQSPKLAWLAQRNSHYVPRSTLESMQDQPATCSYEHGAVLAALADRDEGATRTAMVDHLISSGEILAEHLAASGFWPAAN